MDSKQFEQLEQRIAAGETLTVVEQFLHRAEVRHRAEKPNPLQQQNIDRAKNPLLEPAPWHKRMGMAADRNQDNSVSKGE